MLDLNLKSALRDSIKMFSSVMTSAQTVIDKELAKFGWVESMATNSIIDFKSQRLSILEQTRDEKYSNFIETLIFYLILYLIFC